MATFVNSSYFGSSATVSVYANSCQPFTAGLAAVGLVRATDTGQVVWTATVLTCTAVAVSGSNAIYTYSSYTGPDPRIGMSFTFSTFGNGGNNVTATLTGVDLVGKTVTVVKSTQVTDTTGSGTTTALAAVPTTVNANYEMWRFPDTDPNQATCPIFFRVGFGCVGAATTLQILIQAGTTSNGAGTLSNATANQPINYGHNTPDLATIYENDWSYSAGRLSFIYQRTNNHSFDFPATICAVERIVDNSGVHTDEGFNWVSMVSGAGTHVNQILAQTVLKVGGGGPGTSYPLLPAINYGTGTAVFGNYVGISPIFPILGQARNAMTAILCAQGVDFAEGSQIDITMYGTSHHYFFTKTGQGPTAFNVAQSGGGAFVRFD